MVMEISKREGMQEGIVKVGDFLSSSIMPCFNLEDKQGIQGVLQEGIQKCIEESIQQGVQSVQEGYIQKGVQEAVQKAFSSVMPSLIQAIKAQADIVEQSSQIGLSQAQLSQIESQPSQALSVFKEALIKKFEVARNEVFVAWLKRNVKDVSKNIELHSDESSKHPYCRFSRSKEDFSCSLHQDFDSITVAIQRDKKEIEMEEVELEGISGDCKEDYKESDKYQVLANMLKTASDLAFNAAALYDQLPLLLVC
jgi:hypothetical protein